MENLRRRLSESTDIAKSATALFLLAAFLGACIIGALCILAGAVAYACGRMKIETIAQSAARRLPFKRSAA